jgi:transposase-like protein
MVTTFAEALVNAEADAVCGVPLRVRCDDRTNIRSGYQRREWDTCTGSIE